ncbi:MAG: hypothetical protein ACP5N1_06030 [Candidatus Woesearchaeota archaeon]
MKCPNCKTELRKVFVAVNGAKNKAISYQCPKCDYYEFEKFSRKMVIEDLRTTLKIKQTIVKLSQDRLGMYINKDIVRSLNLKGGEEILVSLPDKNHILIEIN